MKKYKFLFAAVFSLFMFGSCIENYTELNTNEELLGTVDPRNAFTGATMNFNNNSRSHLTGKYSGVMVYMQYLVPSGGPSSGVYVSPSKPNEHPSPYSPAYGDYYGNVGLYLNNIITTLIPNDGEAARYTDVSAISEILLSYKQWQILDTYGAAPITEAFKNQSEGIRTPKYDLYQKGIDGTPQYKTIDAAVKNAVDKLKASSATQYNLGTNDFFYSGNIAKWIKFGNTLRVKMAQRLENADNAFYNSVISEVLTSGSNIIASNDESCIYHHTNDYNNNTDDIQDITKNYCASSAFVNYLITYNDPRLPIMVRRNGFGTGNNNAENDKWFETFKKEYPDYATLYPQFIGRYVGMSANPDSANSVFNRSAYLTRTYTQENGTEANMDIRMNSQIESRYYVKNGGRNGNNNMPVREIESVDFEINQDKMSCFTPIITYPETCFMLAEIAIKKGSAVAGKTATAWFRDGIRASMEQYRQWAINMFVVAQVSESAPNYAPVTDEAINAYLARPEFQEATLEKIISQQWINLYMQPEEMWATWKRTGYPHFKNKPIPENGVAFLETIQSSQVDLVIPRRNQVPQPNTLNIENYNEAIKALKEDPSYGADINNTEGRIWWDKN